MARKNDPYLPLYVMDWLTNLRLKQCSLQAHGLMISIMCVMHKSDDYGKILLRQKSKICLSKKSSKVSDFASTLARFFAWSEEEITPALDELLAEGVLSIEGDSLVCRRMVRDADLSEKRSKAGKDGGDATQKRNQDRPKQPKKKDDFAKANAKAKNQANAEIENESKSDNESSSINTSNVMVLQGGAGGIEKPLKIPPDYIDEIYPRFVSAYGKTKAAVQQYKIQEALLDAVNDCMNRGATYADAGEFLIGCADLARQAAEANKATGYRLAPQTWLSQRCYHSNPLDTVVKVAEKESPAEKAKRELLEYHAKRREKEAQNGQ